MNLWQRDSTRQEFLLTVTQDELKQALYNHGVEMSAGQAYHDEKPGNFRFLFSLDRNTVEEGLRRVIDFYNTRRTDRQ
ncbi:unnamed protein product [Alternaria sp. RS040]